MKLGEYAKDIRRQIDKERRFEDLSRKRGGVCWTITSYKVTDGERIPWHPFYKSNRHHTKYKMDAIHTAAWTAKEGRFINPNHRFENQRGDHCEIDIHAYWGNLDHTGSNRKYIQREELVFQIDTRDKLFSRYWNDHSK